ncbi:MAG: cytidylate kinase-like family protein [Clostridia bacterium]|nr:cytidylate kinase-like family protein [Clostridia bacterium]
MKKFTVTIARGFGSGGRTIGKMLAERLGIKFYDREIMELASEESGINIDLFEKADEAGKVAFFKRYNRAFGKKLISPKSDDFTSTDNLFNYQAKMIHEIADRESSVIVGRCADHILAEHENVLRIFIYSSKGFCIDKVTELYGLSRKEAERKIDRIDRARSTYYRYYTGKDWDNARNYDLCLNTEELGFERCVQIIEHYINVLYK